MKTTDAISFFGSKGKLAKAIGCAQSTVYDWADIVPFDRQQQIQAITRGKLKAMPLPDYLKLKSRRGKRAA